MTHPHWSLAAGLACALVACAHETSPTPVATVPARTSTSAETLEALVGPVGVDLDRDRLVAIAAFIRRWLADPGAPIEPRATGGSTETVMLTWITQSPDVSVSVCPFLEELAAEQGTVIGERTALGAIMGMAAYLIEHPDAAPASAEVQIAGAEGASDFYAASVRGGAEPIPFMEALVDRRRRDGGLATWFTEQGISCAAP